MLIDVIVVLLVGLSCATSKACNALRDYTVVDSNQKDRRMKTSGRTNSVVDSVASAADSIRNQRGEGLATLDDKAAELSAWLDQMIQVRLFDGFLCKHC